MKRWILDLETRSNITSATSYVFDNHDLKVLEIRNFTYIFM